MIRNVVFDVGNVIVRWDPQLISINAFGRDRATPEFVHSVFKHELWYQLNRGEISEADARRSYSEALHLTEHETKELFFQIKASQILIEGTVELLARLSIAGYRLFALTDNVREIVAHLRQQYDFWKYFNGVVVSAEVGFLKPSKVIFEHLLRSYDLNPSETLFVDDSLANVEGAASVAMTGIQFSSSHQVESDLAELGLRF